MMTKLKTKKFLSFLLAFTLMCTLFAGVSLAGTAAAAESGGMLVGVGKGDITGPITEISTGYNSIGDVMQGLLMRLYARAFIVETGDSAVCYVSAEMVHMTESIKPGVLKELQSRGLGQYTEENLMLAATHCHSATSNSSWYPLYSLINGVSGFDQLYYDIVVKGIADAIEQANDNLQPGSITVNTGNVENAVYNRSLAAYEFNEGADMTTDTVANTVNTKMVVLKFIGENGEPIGLLDFFGSHGTSNSIDNTYVASDHKGYAAYEFEKSMGDGFVAAFSQSECGDSSPNQPQEDVTADFQRPSQTDGVDPIENEIVHGTKELTAAENIFAAAGKTLSSTVNYRYKNVEFKNLDVAEEYVDTRMEWDAQSGDVKTSTPCIGAGIIAGDEEGAPVDNAKEGDVKHEYTYDEQTGQWTQQSADFTKIDLSGLEKLFKPLWPAAMTILNSNRFDAEQAEKVVCLNVENFMQTIQPMQVFQIGEVVIAGIPFECTCTEAARIKAVIAQNFPEGTEIILSTLTNSYSQYIATREEYAAQNYEGATSLFGPWSGPAVAQELDKLCEAMASGETVEKGPTPEDRTATPGIQTAASTFGVVRDAGHFGKVLSDVEGSYSADETVKATFQGASPRTATQLKLEGRLKKYFEDYSYMTVEKLGEDGNWTTYRTDDDPYTTFHWERPSGKLSAYSEVTVGWLLTDGSIEPGTYRLRYNGIAKNLFGMLIKFSNASSEFTIA